MNRMGATSPAPRLTARIVPVRMPALACGTTTLKTVWNLVAPSASDASRSSRGTARSASSVATMTTGSVSTAIVSAAQISAGWPKTFSPWKNALSMPAPRNWMKKPEAEQAEDDRRHARQVGDRDADRRASAATRARRTRAGRSRSRRRSGTPASVIRMTISTMPKMAGKMPPAVIPSRGAWVRNAQRQVRRAVADDVEQDDRQDREHDQQRRARRDRQRAVGEEVAARARARCRRAAARSSAAAVAVVRARSRRAPEPPLHAPDRPVADAC